MDLVRCFRKFFSGLNVQSYFDDAPGRILASGRVSTCFSAWKGGFYDCL